MFVLRRIIILLLPVIWIIGLELVRNNHGWLWWTMVVFLLYLVLAVFMLGQVRLKQSFFQFLIMPVVFSTASFTFMLFLVDTWAFHFFAILTGLAIYFLLNQYFVFVNFPYKYQPYTLESLSFYIGLLLIYFLFSAAFAGQILLKLNLWFLLGLIVPLLGLVLYHFFWIHKINFKKSWLFIVAIIVALLELMISVGYLPTSYYVNAFILAVAAYVMLGLSREFIQKALDRKKVISYLSIGGGLLLLILTTAQWG